MNIKSIGLVIIGFVIGVLSQMLIKVSSIDDTYYLLKSIDDRLEKIEKRLKSIEKNTDNISQNFDYVMDFNSIRVKISK